MNRIWRKHGNVGARTAAVVLTLCAVARAEGLEALLARFWAAPSPGARAEVAAEIVASGAAFEEVHAGLARGRSYADTVPRGRLVRERQGVGGRHPYMILVPEDYTPAKRWPVRLDLHGGMGAKEWKGRDGAWSSGWKEAFDQIVIVPAGWWDSMWWEWSQVSNFEAILKEVRATWNIDENRVVVYGGSDGGAALFFHAMRQPDRYAGYAGHVAPPDRLVRAEFRPDGQLHLSNLAGQRFHLGYGENDEKVPLRFIEKYMELFARHGALLDWYVLPGQGHSLRVPPEREQELARFLWRTTRDPLPDRLSWATERTDRYHRRSWLVIDELAPPGTRTPADESNLLPRLGTSLQLRGPTMPRLPYGQVDVVREGNRFTARTRSVAHFRLLLAPGEVDLSQPITVLVDGRVAFEGMVKPDVTTLLSWAASDDDRTMLFAAELVLP